MNCSRCGDSYDDTPAAHTEHQTTHDDADVRAKARADLWLESARNRHPATVARPNLRTMKF